MRQAICVNRKQDTRCQHTTETAPSTADVRGDESDLHAILPVGTTHRTRTAARALQAAATGAAPSRAITLQLSPDHPPVARSQTAYARQTRFLLQQNTMAPPRGEAAQPPGSHVVTPVVSRRPRRLDDVGARSRHPFSLALEAVCFSPAGRHARSPRLRLTALPAHARNGRWPSLHVATNSLVARAPPSTERLLPSRPVCSASARLPNSNSAAEHAGFLRGDPRKRVRGFRWHLASFRPVCLFADCHEMTAEAWRNCVKSGRRRWRVQ